MTPHKVSRKVFLLRHLLAGLCAALVVYLFWLSRPEWTAEMRLWRAFGDAGYTFLFAVLLIGPAARLWNPAARALLRRREIGIWCAILVITHSLLILDGWARWDVMRFLGYEVISQLGRYARLEPGFGLANLLGLIALFWMVLLFVTSSDRAIELLGAASWKRIQNAANAMFYVVAIHASYFLFIHYTISFHRRVPEPNWFRFVLVSMALTVFVLQTGAFIKTITQRRAKRALDARI